MQEMNLQHYRRSPRLKDFDYRGPLSAFLTFVTRGRARFFVDRDVVAACMGALDRSTNKANAEVLAFCFMPDHLHLLVSLPAGTSMQELVRHFKQLSGFEAKRLIGQSLWQISYFDRILRRDEDVFDVAKYIWENPVRKGLVEDWQKYPYSGPKDLMQA